MIGTRPFLTSDPPAACDTGSLQGDLEALAVLVVHRLHRLDGGLGQSLHDASSALDLERVAGILQRARLRGELTEHGQEADPELVRAMLVGPMAWPLLGGTADGPSPRGVAALVAATLQR